MELVLLQDVQSSYAANWARVANTEGINEIQIRDRFREQGFGPGAEELEVAGIDISPVGGFSRIFFNRGANATTPEVHRLGAVFHMVGIARPQAPIPEPEAAPVLDKALGATAASVPDPFEPQPLVALRKRGRPIGSKNKPKLPVSA